MKFNILTIFPKLFDSFLNETLIKKAIQAKLLEINVVDIRAYATDKHHTTDDTPYGGGPGMVMKVEPIFLALDALEISVPSPTVIGDPSVEQDGVDSRRSGNGHLYFTNSFVATFMQEAQRSILLPPIFTF